MTVRAPKRRDHAEVMSAQPVLGRRLLRQSTRFAAIAFVRPWRYCDARNGGGLRQSTSERRRRSYRYGSATRLAPRSCSASTAKIAALYDYACPNNGGLTSIAQEAIGSLRVDIGGAILRRQTKRETGADSVESYGVVIGDSAPLGL
jgi:hypothetical protein